MRGTCHDLVLIEGLTIDVGDVVLVAQVVPGLRHGVFPQEAEPCRVARLLRVAGCIGAALDLLGRRYSGVRILDEDTVHVRRFSDVEIGDIEEHVLRSLLRLDCRTSIVVRTVIVPGRCHIVKARDADALRVPVLDAALLQDRTRLWHATLQLVVGVLLPKEEAIVLFVQVVCDQVRLRDWEGDEVVVRGRRKVVRPHLVDNGLLVEDELLREYQRVRKGHAVEAQLDVELRIPVLQELCRQHRKPDV